MEGGGNRGIFTSGVYVIGVSAGACNAVDYVSKQIGRTKECMMGKDFPTPLIRYRYLLEKRMLVDMDLLFDEVPNKINLFDYDEYFRSSIRCELVATDCITGKPVYLDENCKSIFQFAFCISYGGGGWYSILGWRDLRSGACAQSIDRRIQKTGDHINTWNGISEKIVKSK